jgi:hypothetical protein
MVELIATIAAGLWAGIALYIAFVEQPSALQVGVVYATEYFRVMSKRTAPIMIVLAGIGGIAGIYAYYQNDDSWWAFGGGLLLLQFPLTAVFILPTNLKLMKEALSTTEALQLHRRWARLHAIRTALGILPFFYFVSRLI